MLQTQSKRYEYGISVQSFSETFFLYNTKSLSANFLKIFLKHFVWFVVRFQSE